MVTIAGAIVGAIITCALSLLGSYVMIKYQLKKQRQYEIIKGFVDEVNLLFTDFERGIRYTEEKTQGSPDGLALQKGIEERGYRVRALVFLMKDSPYIETENKKIAEEIYSNFAIMVNKQGHVTPYMEAVRSLLGRLAY